jgi:tetratricopeptide (TPR) repeat protein
MIERLLAAEAAFARGEVELAGRLFAQVAEADPRNAIASVGLARIAQREGRDDEARQLAERALQIDPDEAAAAQLLREMALATKSGQASRQAPEPTPPGDEPMAPAYEPLPPVLEAAPSATPPGTARRPLLGRVRDWLRGLLGRA